MKKDTFFYNRIFPLIFMFISTAVCITLVSGIYLSTEERVLANEQLYLRMAVLYASGISYTRGDIDGVQRIYEERVSEENGWFRVSLEDDVNGYIVPATGSGLWGPIEMLLGFREDLSTMIGISIVSHNETPGLGARIDEEWFKEQFRGKQGPFVMVDEGTAQADDEIDSITGATRTSVAVRDIINRGIEEASDIVRGN